MTGIVKILTNSEKNFLRKTFNLHIENVGDEKYTQNRNPGQYLKAEVGVAPMSSARRYSAT
jgi:hypothetical protein